MDAKELLKQLKEVIKVDIKLSQQSFKLLKKHGKDTGFFEGQLYECKSILHCIEGNEGGK